MNATSTPIPQLQKKKFSSRLSFSHQPPYEAVFAERVPVIHAFSIALLNYQQMVVRESSRLGGKLKRLARPDLNHFRAVECGVYTGSSLLACASIARAAGIPCRLTGLDTFEGLPPLSEKDRSLTPSGAKYLETTLFADTSLEAVQAKVVAAGFRREVDLRKGLFSQTLPALPERRYHWVNIDCDLYEPHLECLEYFYPRMVKGGIIFFDDYHSVEFPMAGRSVDDFMQDKPEQLTHLRFGNDAPNRTKTFLVKY